MLTLTGYVWGRNRATPQVYIYELIYVIKHEGDPCDNDMSQA